MSTLEGVEPTIRVYSGRDFNFLNPKPTMIDIRDIAHGLSMVCRFSGQCTSFYSVAQHSTVVSMLTRGASDLPLWGLLHDASEAYLQDIPRPLKRHLPEYQEIEERVQMAIACKFGLRWPMPREVKEADNKALSIEWLRFMNGRQGEMGITSTWPTKQAVKLIDHGLDPEAAEAEFMSHFKDLTS